MPTNVSEFNLHPLPFPDAFDSKYSYIFCKYSSPAQEVRLEDDRQTSHKKAEVILPEKCCLKEKIKQSKKIKLF